MQISYIGHKIQMLELIMGSWKTQCIIVDLIRGNDDVGDHNTHSHYLLLISLPYIKMNSALVVFIFIHKQLIISSYSSRIAVKQLQYIAAWHYTDDHILKYENNYTMHTNFHDTFSQLRIESLPLNHRAIKIKGQSESAYLPKFWSECETEYKFCLILITVFCFLLIFLKTSYTHFSVIVIWWQTVCIKSDTENWPYQQYNHEHFQNVELLFNALSQISKEIWLFRVLIYLGSWWCHQWCHQFIFTKGIRNVMIHMYTKFEDDIFVRLLTKNVFLSHL